MSPRRCLSPGLAALVFGTLAWAQALDRTSGSLGYNFKRWLNPPIYYRVDPLPSNTLVVLNGRPCSFSPYGYYAYNFCMFGYMNFYASVQPDPDAYRSFHPYHRRRFGPPPYLVKPAPVWP